MAKYIISYILLLLLTQGSSTNRFQLNLIRELSKNNAKSDNFVMAPYAVDQALAELFLQREKRRDYQLAKALRITGQGPEKIESYYSKANTKGIQQQFKMANRIYYSDKFPISPHMKKISQKLNVDVEKLANGPKTGEEINSWLGKTLDHNGTKLWSNDGPTGQTKMVAVQGLSVDALWKHKFQSLMQKTVLIDVPNKNPIRHNVEMMYTMGPFDYLIKDDVRGVKIPLSTTDINLVILIARQTTRTQQILENLDKYLTLKMEKTNKTHLYLFPFTLHTTLDLSEAIKTLGINKVFTEYGAPNNTASSPIFKQHSMLSVQPQRFLLKNEYQDQDDEKVVIVNQPFVFVIKDQRTIYMAGRVDSIMSLAKPM